MNPSASSESAPLWLTITLPLMIVVLSGVHLFVSPNRVAELEVVPDSVEYAIAAHSFATTGRYVIQVNGQSLPPRYPPGFSVLLLSPIYFLAPSNIGNGILAVWVAGIAAALFAYLIGTKLAGPWAGALAAILLLHHPQFAAYTQVIMTDVPAVALGLAAFWIYLKIAEQRQSSTLWLLAAGFIVALSVSMRPLTGLIALPFLVHQIVHWRKNLIVGLAVFCVPSAIVVAATGLELWRAFGDWHRTGYQFWLAVPYDYLQLTFSPRYLKDNVAIFQWNLIWVPLVLGIFGIIILLKKRLCSTSPALTFVLLGAVPLSVIHLFYFFTDIRFHFLLISVAIIFAGAGIALVLPAYFRGRFGFVLPLLVLTILLPRIPSNPLEEGDAIRNRIATVCGTLLPTDALLISGIDPTYLEFRVARGTARRILPLNRKTPYANSVLVTTRIPDPRPVPRNAADHACLGLVRGGGRPLYQSTADEEIEQMHLWISQGVPIYLELLSTEPSEPARIKLSNNFQFESFSKDNAWLVRLRSGR